MGFFQKLFSRSTKVEQDEPLHITTEEIESRLKARLAEIENQSFEDGLINVKGIIKAGGSAKAIVEEIGDIEFDDDIKSRTYKPIITSKPVYVRGMREALKGIRERQPENFGDLEKYNQNVIKALKSIQTIQLKKGRYMKHAFEKDVLKLGSTLNKIIDENNSLNTNISEVKDFQSTSESIQSRIDEVMDIIGSQKKLKDNIRIQRETKTKNKKRLQEIESEIDALKSSKEHIKYQNKLTELEEYIRERKKLENSILKSIGPLKRPLRKLEKKLNQQKGVEKVMLKKIKEYQKAPGSTFSQEDPSDILLEKILGRLKDAISTGEISLDNREKTKAISRIEELTSHELKQKLHKFSAVNKRESKLKTLIDNSSVMEKIATRSEEKDRYLEEQDEQIASENDEPSASKMYDLKTEIEDLTSKLLNRPVILVLPESVS